MKYQVRFIVIILGMILLSPLYAQTIHQVAEGTNVISEAINAASSGDIIELTTSGGKYIENDSIYFKFGLTIRAKDGLDVQPSIFSKAHHIFFVGAEVGLDDNYWINIENVTIDGLLIEGADTTVLSGRVFEIADGATYHCIKVEGCTIQNMYAKLLLSSSGNKFLWPTSNSYTDSLILSNNIVQHFSPKGSDFIYAKNRPGVFGYILIENSTFWDGGPTILRVESGTNEALSQDISTQVIINHLTVSGMSQPWSAVKDANANAIVKNLIVSNRVLGQKLSPAAASWTFNGEGDVVTNILADSCDFWGITDSSTYYKDVDPIFEDPQNGNFNLVQGSPAIGAADDGGNIGDPRWTVVLTAVKDNGEVSPQQFALQQNYPNPFNPSTSIKFSISKYSHVKLQIFNLLGQLVATLLDENITAGNKTVNWNAAGKMSGVYFYRLTSGNNTIVKKMILMK